MYLKKDLFGIIEQFQPDLCIVNTFILEQAVMNKVADALPGDGVSIVFYDPRSGMESAVLSEDDNVQFFSEKYLPVPVKKKGGIFHSKLIVLVKKQEKSIKAIVITGSFNLAKQSFSEDGIETAVCMELDTNNDDDNALLKEISAYLVEVIEDSCMFDISYKKKVIDIMNDIYADTAQTGNMNWPISFVTNGMGASIANVLKAEINRHGSNCNICIASPFIDYSEDIQVYLKGIEFKSLKIHTRHTQKNIDAAKKYDQETCIPAPGIRNGHPERFHSKIIFISGKNEYTAVVGSSNFTAPGFYRSNGNIECGVILRGKNNDELFNSLNSWFSIGWRKPDEASIPIEHDDEGDNQDELMLLFLAEIVGNGKDKIIRLHYCVDEDMTAIIDGIKKSLFKSGTHSDLPYSNNKHEIKIKIDSKVMRIAVIDSSTFVADHDSGLNGILADVQESSGGNATEYNVLSSYIQRHGDSVKSWNTEIKEPPALEKYYQNIKNEYSRWARRKYFTKREIDVFIHTIMSSSGGPGVYKILRIMEMFNGVDRLDPETKKKLNELTEEHIKKMHDIITVEDFNKLITIRKKGG